MTDAHDELRKLLANSPDTRLLDGFMLREAAASVRLDRDERGQTHVVEEADEVTPSEHDEQAALFGYIDRRKNQDPAWGLIFAIPNGGHRHKAVAAKMKAEGVRAGVPDIFVATPRGAFHGAFIEMKKVGGKKPTAEQYDWIYRLSAQRYYCATCYGFKAAKATIEEYLSMGNRALEVTNDA